ncbi:type IV pilin protein [Variovorax ginsengisoli]|uniref:Type IV pilus assembly protein PilE n=1 Tax=Variovorax ginsengisoli TaxID=363844 RepID=A0ABT9SE72_9BURK|nr:type IV pilin protein [Variovorax ginsengisoli]MDP9902666.1 type IV pilus assembly protein PilE [Variovorax ginsengisoli]
MNTPVSRTCRQVRVAGFTLIEMLIAAAIVAVMFAISLPRYQEHVQRAHRVEARTGLLQAAHWLERVATAQGTYPVSEDGASVLPAALRGVPGGRYAIALEASTPSAYTLVAEPQGAQSADACGRFTLDQTGARGVVHAGVRGDTDQVAACWGR